MDASKLAVVCEAARSGLGHLWNRYDKQIDKFIKFLFTEHVAPFCQKRRYEFMAGNGTYWIGPPNGPHIDYWDIPEDDEELKGIFELLELDVPGYPANSVGTLMPDYNLED